MYTLSGVYQETVDGSLVAPSVEEIVADITNNGPYVIQSTDGSTKYELAFTEISYDVANWEATWTATGTETSDPVDCPTEFILRKVTYTDEA